MSAPWPSQDGPDSRSASGSSSPEDHQPRTPTASNADSPLLAPADASAKPPTRSFSQSNAFVSSPLNPHTAHALRSRPGSRGSTHFTRIASEESQALSSPYSSLNPMQRGSMVLYRLATDDNEMLMPPRNLQPRDSVASSSGDSIFSLSSDSKYPSGLAAGRGPFVPYAYDPDLDMKDEGEDDDDFLADRPERRLLFCSIRGLLNVGVLILLIGALLALFVCYPVLEFFHNSSRNLATTANIRINATGQAPALCVCLFHFSFFSFFFSTPW